MKSILYLPAAVKDQVQPRLLPVNDHVQGELGIDALEERVANYFFSYTSP